MKILLQKSVLLIALFMLSSSLSYSQKGWWLFDDPANLTAAESGFGSALELTGTLTATAGPTPSNGAVSVPKGSYLKMTHGISPNGGGTLVNKYSLMFDFSIPASAWHTFFQVDEIASANDGDLFIKPSGEIGTAGAGYSTFVTALNTWYRLIITVENGVANKSYIDGQLIVDWNAYAIDTRYALNPTLLLFADNDGDDADIDVAEVAIWDYALSSEEVLAFGSVGLPLPVEPTSFVPDNYSLEQNYPNPFNPSTTITYSLQNSEVVTLRVFDILGCEVATLVNQYQSAGRHAVSFNAGNLPSGIYLYKIEAGSFQNIKKLMILK
ncbi:MAG: T9SS type A sorting domain-containing protein [Bacteroidota bacterium]